MPTGRPVGRPTRYGGDAVRLATQGVTLQHIADTFGVTERVVCLWRLRYPEFREALNEGRALRAQRAERARRAHRGMRGGAHDLPTVAEQRFGADAAVSSQPAPRFSTAYRGSPPADASQPPQEPRRRISWFRRLELAGDDEHYEIVKHVRRSSVETFEPDDYDPLADW